MPEQKPKVPFIIREAAKAIDKDVTPTVRLMGRLFLKSFLEEHERAAEGQQRPSPAPALRGPTREPISARAVGIQIREVRDPRNPPVTSAVAVSKPAVIDAEIVPDVGAPQAHRVVECLTCGGTKRVGRRGHQVQCPSCCKS